MTASRALSCLCLPALLLFSGCGGEEGDQHDVVKVELLRANPSDDPFRDTVKMQVQLSYTSCLVDFYQSSNTEWAQKGEKGGPVFQEWVDRLCDADVYPESPECEVEAIDQNLGSTSSTNLNLKVTYNILDPNLTRKIVTFGPLPKESLVNGCAPEVELNAGSVLGFNAANEIVWSIESFDAFNKAVTGQSGAIKVNIVRSPTAP